jgi:hypothetical protein
MSSVEIQPILSIDQRPRWVVCFTDRISGWSAVATHLCSEEEAIDYARWLVAEGCEITRLIAPDGTDLVRSVAQSKDVPSGAAADPAPATDRSGRRVVVPLSPARNAAA